MSCIIKLSQKYFSINHNRINHIIKVSEQKKDLKFYNSNVKVLKFNNKRFSWFWSCSSIWCLWRHSLLGRHQMVPIETFIARWAPNGVYGVITKINIELKKFLIGKHIFMLQLYSWFATKFQRRSWDLINNFFNTSCFEFENFYTSHI